MKCPKCNQSEKFRVVAWEAQYITWDYTKEKDGFWHRDASKYHDSFSSAISPDEKAKCLATECGYEGFVQLFEDQDMPDLVKRYPGDIPSLKDRVVFEFYRKKAQIKRKLGLYRKELA